MKPDQPKKLVVIVGPTASGKTEVAVRLAEHWHTEIISADSRQVFAELNIGTAKPSAEQLTRVPHHFIGHLPITQPYDAAAFALDARSQIDALFHKHDKVILCGGSGLYIRAALEGFDTMPDVPVAVREKITEDYRDKGLSWLQERVRETDPEYFGQADQKNPHRLIRALSVFMASGERISSLRKRQKIENPFDIFKFGLDIEKAALDERIDRRMDEMVEQGLIAEASALFSFRHLTALQTVGYQEVFDEMDGKYERAETIRLLKRNSRRYAKRQLTWFKKDPEITWLAPGLWNEMIKLVEQETRKA